MNKQATTVLTAEYRHGSCILKTVREKGVALLSFWVWSGQAIPAFFDLCYSLKLSHNMGKIGSKSVFHGGV